MHPGQVEQVETSGVTVGCRTVAGGSLDLEADQAAVGRAEVAVLVDYTYRDVCQVFSVGCKYIAVGGEFQVMRLSCRADHFLLCRFPLFIVGHDFHFTRFIYGVIPHQAVTVLYTPVVLGLFPVALPVDEQFCRGVVGIGEYRYLFSFVSFPVPMGQHMQGFRYLVPDTPVKVIAVFR